MVEEEDIVTGIEMEGATAVDTETMTTHPAGNVHTTAREDSMILARGEGTSGSRRLELSTLIEV